MKTMMIILESHYNKQELRLRVKAEKAEKLFKPGDDAIFRIMEDVDRVYYGIEPLYISIYQARLIDNYFATGVDYFDKVYKVL